MDSARHDKEMAAPLSDIIEDQEVGQPLSRFWQPLADRWLLLLVIPAAVVLAVLAFQAVKKPVHVIQLTVAPTRELVSGIDSQLGNLSRLAAVAGVNVGKGDASVSDFARLRYLLFSVRLGEYQAQHRPVLSLVFKDQWDGSSWQKPSGPWQWVKDTFYPLFGLEPWVVPDGRSLATYYNDHLSMAEVGETGLHRIRLEDTDLARGEKLLGWLVTDVNEMVRRDAAERAGERAAYLRQQIQLSPVTEYRENLATMLAKEEQTLMLASTSLPFAADVVQPVTSGHNPESQRPLLFGALGGVLGLGFAMFVALLLGPRRR